MLAVNALTHSARTNPGRDNAMANSADAFSMIEVLARSGLRRFANEGLYSHLAICHDDVHQG